MRLNHLITKEEMEKAQVEAKNRTDIDYDKCLSGLIDKYYDTKCPRTKQVTAERINKTLQRMHVEGYPVNCIRVYTTLWRYVKEAEEKRGTKND